MACNHDELIVDFYFLIDKNDIEQKLDFAASQIPDEVRCSECGTRFNGKFTITELTEITEEQEDESY